MALSWQRGKDGEGLKLFKIIGENEIVTRQKNPQSIYKM
jgi:hypothetical protein